MRYSSAAMVCILSILPFIVFAQPDSTIQKLAREKDNNRRIVLYITVSTQYRGSDPDLSFQYADSAFALAVSSGIEVLQVQPLLNKGICKYLSGENKEAFNYYNRALEIAKRLQNDSLTAKTHNNIGALFQNMGDYGKAVHHYMTSLKIREKIRDAEGIAVSFNNLGNAYNFMGDYPKALESHLKALRLRDTVRDKAGIVTSLSNIGSVFYSLDSSVQAAAYYNRALAVCRQLQSPLLESGVLLNLSSIYRDAGKFLPALDLLMQSLRLKKQTGDVQGEAIVLYNMGLVMQMQKRMQEAKSYFLSALKIALQVDNPENAKQIYQQLYNIEKSSGNYRQALGYLSRYTELKDSLAEVSGALTAAKLQERYEIESEALKLQQIRDEQEKRNEESLRAKNTLQYFSITLLVIVVLVVVFFSGKFPFSRYQAEALVFITAIILFEYLNLWIEPVIGSVSGSSPFWKLVVNCLVACLIFPVESYVEEKLKSRALRDTKK